MKKRTLPERENSAAGEKAPDFRKRYALVALFVLAPIVVLGAVYGIAHYLGGLDATIKWLVEDVHKLTQATPPVPPLAPPVTPTSAAGAVPPVPQGGKAETESPPLVFSAENPTDLETKVNNLSAKENPFTAAERLYNTEFYSSESRIPPEVKWKIYISMIDKLLKGTQMEKNKEVNRKSLDQALTIKEWVNDGTKKAEQARLIKDAEERAGLDK